MHFVEGARWAEDVVGTNAPGTALAVDHAVQIYGSEHFRRPVQPWSCSAAPVHDPLTGAAARRHRRHRRRPRRQPARAHPGAGDRGRGRVGAALAAPRAAAARHAGACRRRCSGWRPRLDVLGRERARLTLPSGPLELSLRHSELLAAAGRGRRRGRGPHHRPAGRRVPPRRRRARSPSGPSCPGCAGWSAPTSSAPGPTGCSAGSTPTSTRSAGCWPAARSARRWSAIPAPSCPARSAPGVAVGPGAGVGPAPPGGAAQPPSRAAAPLRAAAGGPGRRRRLADLPGVAAAELAAPGGRRRAPAAAATRAHVCADAPTLRECARRRALLAAE